MDLYVHVSMCVCLSDIHNYLTQKISLHAVYVHIDIIPLKPFIRYYLYLFYISNIYMPVYRSLDMGQRLAKFVITTSSVQCYWMEIWQVLTFLMNLS
jgi:hypothetical protein